MSEHSTIEYRYWAFISHNHRDAKCAEWIHRGIETFKVPPQLVGRLTSTGFVAPNRMNPLFLDRAELSASFDLTIPIQQALMASRFLIVVCSPNSANSSWVNKEIMYFRQLGRPERVLAIIVGGDPGAHTEGCFPSALRDNQPLAADARPARDGKHRALLKLLAGMLGVNFDTLLQREIRRRRSRWAMRSVIAAFILFAIAFCVAVTAYAVDSKQGMLIVTSDPPGATISVNGVELGKTPYTNNLVRPRGFRVRLEKTGFRSEEIPAQVIAGMGTPVSVRLAPQSGVNRHCRERRPLQRSPSSKGKFWSLAMGLRRGRLRR